MILITAYQLAENINIKRYKADLSAKLLSESSFELFYKYNDGFVYVLNYGVVVFANMEEKECLKIIDKLKTYSENINKELHHENYTIKKGSSDSPEFSYNELHVPEISDDVIRITMLHVGQSAALDFYQEKSQTLFHDSMDLSSQLEKYGQLKIRKKELNKFIGKTLNTKNRIIDNLYVIDNPPAVWEKEMLGKINDGLARTFDTTLRFREIEYMLKSIEESLSIFVEYVNARESKRLEWIVIILILLEVLHSVYDLLKK